MILLTGLALAGLVSGAPASAFERMTNASCASAINAIAPPEIWQEDLPAISLTSDGWCRMSGRSGGRSDAGYDTLDWRAEQGSGDIPLALELRVAGMDPDEMQGGPATTRPMLQLTGTLRQVPEAGQLLVERMELRNDAGDRIAGSLVFERVMLSSRSAAQMSLGSGVLKGALFEVEFGGLHENPFGLGLKAELRGSSNALSEAVFSVLSALPEGVMSDASRAELTAFAGDLPRPEGRLEMSLAAERGLGVMQVAAGMNRLAFGLEDTDGLEVLLDGIRIGADWTPAETIAD